MRVGNAGVGTDDIATDANDNCSPAKLSEVDFLWKIISWKESRKFEI